jgi:hypothetical protein
MTTRGDSGASIGSAAAASFPQFVEGVVSKYPRLRFLFTNGYSPASARLEGLAELPVEVLHKPYGLNNLARAVRRAVELPPR